MTDSERLALPFVIERMPVAHFVPQPKPNSTDVRARAIEELHFKILARR
jgi:hypothetical protein